MSCTVRSTFLRGVVLQAGEYPNLLDMLRDDLLSSAVLCVLANKQDLPGAVSVKELTDFLELTSLPSR